MFDVRFPELSVWPMMSTVRFCIFASAAAIWSRISLPCGVSVALPVSNSIVRFASVWSSTPCSDADTRSPFLIVYVGFSVFAMSLASCWRCASLCTSPFISICVPLIFSCPLLICLSCAPSSFCTFALQFGGVATSPTSIWSTTFVAP
ncbi:hypothetical protein BLA6993_07477 [Burkholderia lata]|nr:hypothetical protein BLA6993_07477 [Burkholderia lata]